MGLILHEKLAILAILGLQFNHFTVMVLLLLRSTFEISCQLRLTRRLYVKMISKEYDYSVERSRFVEIRHRFLFPFSGVRLILLVSFVPGCSSSLLERILL